MKYKIQKGCALFDKLNELNQRVIKAKEACDEFVKSVGGIKYARSSGSPYLASVDAVEFEQKPDGWKPMGNSWQRLYYPKADKKNKKIFEALRAIPEIEYDELNEIIGFKSVFTSKGDSLVHIKSPAVYFGDEFMLVDVDNDVKYKPLDGMAEILESDFVKLKNILEPEKVSQQED